jgi:hypothetical protein
MLVASAAVVFATRLACVGPARRAVAAADPSVVLR